MSSISAPSLSAFSNSSSSGLMSLAPVMPAAPVTPPAEELAVEGKFQEFVSGTFYKQMLKALRAAERPPAYLNGGQAEKIFRSQLDEIVTDSLAKRPDDALAGDLFQQFAAQHPDLVRR